MPVRCVHYTVVATWSAVLRSGRVRGHGPSRRRPSREPYRPQWHRYTVAVTLKSHRPQMSLTGHVGVWTYIVGAGSDDVGGLNDIREACREESRCAWMYGESRERTSSRIRSSSDCDCFGRAPLCRVV
ncbi:hypothetical protein SVAN01_07349 [Stagonosporopsis vannaccii]|nr:hypothetical protein SVAN01_07349 [Stagonosporopsis vannaccii]